MATAVGPAVESPLRLPHAVVVEGLEYLVSLNGFSSVLRFVQTLNEKVVVNDSYLLISANADAMKEQEYNVLAKEMAGEL